MDSSKRVRSSSERGMPTLWMENYEYGLVRTAGKTIGAVRQRLDGRWEAMVGSPSQSRAEAARRVVEAWNALHPAERVEEAS